MVPIRRAKAEQGKFQIIKENNSQTYLEIPCSHFIQTRTKSMAKISARESDAAVLPSLISIDAGTYILGALNSPIIFWC